MLDSTEIGVIVGIDVLFTLFVLWWAVRVLATPRWRLRCQGVVSLACGATLALVATASASSGSSTTPTTTTVSGGGLTAVISSAHRGWISAQLTGPPGATVTLAEADSAGNAQLLSAALPASGRLHEAHLLADSCTLRIRTVTAGLSGAAPLSANVATPACTDRLSIHAPHTAATRSGTTLTLSDRWKAGALPYTLCLNPPAGTPSCQHASFKPDQTTVPVHLDLPRVGGWQVTVQVPDGAPDRLMIWAGHPGPIRLLAAGDSEMQVLDDDLATALAPYGVKVTSAAYESTGLTNPWLFNWQTKAQKLVASVHPDISIVSMGANDGYAIGSPGPGAANCCDASWSAGYGRLVGQMARTLLQGQSASALWFVLAAPKPPQFQRVFNAVNAGIRDAAHGLPGRLALVNANAYFTPGDQYRNFMTVGGQGFTIHESDGIHLDATADQYAAKLVVQQLLAERLIH